MDTVNEIVTDSEMIIAIGNANFGIMENRDVIQYGLLKCACGYYQGHTSTQIITELKLITKAYKLTAKGKRYLWIAFNNNSRI